MANRNYIHPPLGQETASVSGRYVFERELRLEVNGREALCLVGHATFDSSCCGSGGCGYAWVPGYVIGWKTGRDERGADISTVEPISDPAARREIEDRLRASELVHQVQFDSGGG